MPSRIEDACRTAGQPVPGSRAALARCILDSLAVAYARAVDDASRLSGREIRTIHLVGGGANNDLLCRLTADACGVPVVAGPVEATAVGNLLVQARTHGLRLGRAGRPARAGQGHPAAAPVRAGHRSRDTGTLTPCASACSSPASTTCCSPTSARPWCGCCAGSARPSSSPTPRPAAARSTSTPAIATTACRSSGGSPRRSRASMRWSRPRRRARR